MFHSSYLDLSSKLLCINFISELPAAILQDRFFSADRPRYMNYAAIGQVIGHEITHGFDNKGRQYDSNGNLDEWWDPNTRQQFLEKAKCIIDQYGNYTDSQTNLKLNGINTQGIDSYLRIYFRI